MKVIPLRSRTHTPAPTPLEAVRPEHDPEPAPLTPEQAFRRYASYVAAVAMRLLGRDDEVDDVVQDVFMSSLSGLQRLQAPGAIKGWLATVTVRIAGRRLRMRKVRAFLGMDALGGDYEEVAAPGASPEDRALLARIYTVLDQLPVNQRVAWTLRYLEGERLENVARLCGCSLATAKRRIAAAHDALEKVLRDE